MPTLPPDSETLLLTVTRQLLAQGSETDLCQQGLAFLSEVLGTG